MPFRDSAAASVRRAKEASPEKYCAERRCLWFIGHGKPCPRHPRHNVGRMPVDLSATDELPGADDARAPEGE